MLIDALVNIRRELAFFDNVVERYELQVEDRDGQSSKGPSLLRPSPITRAYIDFFASVSSPGASLLEGLVALWGTEKCYHEAWQYAKSFIPKTSTTETYSSDADAGALRKDLVPNWTSAEFGRFVQAIGGLVDELAGAEETRAGNGEWEVVKGKCEEVWGQLLWLEERFWPVPAVEVWEGAGVEMDTQLRRYGYGSLT